MNYDQALAHLDSIGMMKREWDLEVIRSLLRELGDPQKKMKIINITGTNGKGSATAMIASVLHMAGFRVGRYTSPHVDDFRERIWANGKRVGKQEFGRIFSEVMAAACRAHVEPSFFEATTATALCFFAEKNCDYAVLEAGMGGRLDATNVGEQAACVITNVSLDHTEMLGKTVCEIAKEKSALITGKTCITAATGEALHVIQRRCREIGAKLVEVGKTWSIRVSDEWKNGGEIRLKRAYAVRLGLLGEHQFANAAVAISCVEELAPEIGVKAVEAGIAKAKLPGRMEINSRDPLVIMDGGHNPGALETLAKSLSGLKRNRLIAVMGMMKDKDVEGGVAKIAPLANTFIATRCALERSADVERVAAAAEKFCTRVLREPNPKKALELAIKIAGKGDLVLMAGSIYILSEARGENTLRVGQ